MKVNTPRMGFQMLGMPKMGRMAGSVPHGIHFDTENPPTDPPTPKPPKGWAPSTDEEKAWAADFASRMFAEGASKAEKTYQAEVTALKADNDKLKGEVAEAKSGKDKNGAKLYSEEEVQRIVQQAKDELKPKLEAAEKAVEGMRTAKMRSAISDATVKHKGRNADLIHLALKEQLSVDEDGNVYVLGEKGNPRLNSEGKKMGVDELVGAYLKDHDYLREGANLPGNGSNNHNRDPKNPQNTSTIKTDADALSALSAAFAGGISNE